MNRYSDKDLNFFNALLEGKKSICIEQIENYKAQLEEISANGKDENGLENAGYNTQVEYLMTSLDRIRSYLYEIDNALIRIKNKSYGICSISNELIDKKRLVAVPTTTKSILSKQLKTKE